MATHGCTNDKYSSYLEDEPHHLSCALGKSWASQTRNPSSLTLPWNTCWNNCRGLKWHATLQSGSPVSTSWRLPLRSRGCPEWPSCASSATFLTPWWRCWGRSSIQETKPMRFGLCVLFWSPVIFWELRLQLLLSDVACSRCCLNVLLNVLGGGTASSLRSSRNHHWSFCYYLVSLCFHTTNH